MNRLGYERYMYLYLCCIYIFNIINKFNKVVIIIIVFRVIDVFELFYNRVYFKKEYNGSI